MADESDFDFSFGGVFFYTCSGRRSIDFSIFDLIDAGSLVFFSHTT